MVYCTDEAQPGQSIVAPSLVSHDYSDSAQCTGSLAHTIYSSNITVHVYTCTYMYVSNKKIFF